MAKTKKHALTFEEQLLRIEQIVELLDRGETPIEEMMALYEEGMQLLQSARGYLQTTEQKITVLQQTYTPQSTAKSRTEEAGEGKDKRDAPFLF